MLYFKHNVSDVQKKRCTSYSDLLMSLWGPWLHCTLCLLWWVFPNKVHRLKLRHHLRPLGRCARPPDWMAFWSTCHICPSGLILVLIEACVHPCPPYIFQIYSDISSVTSHFEVFPSSLHMVIYLPAGFSKARQVTSQTPSEHTKMKHSESVGRFCWLNCPAEEWSWRWPGSCTVHFWRG